MSLGALNGAVCPRMRVFVPAWGCWWADVDVSEPLEVAKGETVALTLAGVSLSGVSASGGAFEGRASYRIVGGKGGWGKDVAKRGYVDDGGVKASKVLVDAAKDCGEVLGTPPTNRLGPHYARQAGPASDTLNLIARKAWYVDFNGVTQFGKRASSVYAGDAPRTKVDKAGRIIALATDSIEGLVPGVVVDGLRPATDVEYDLTPDRLTVRVYAGTRTTRRLDAIARVIKSLFPDLAYSGVWEYRVVTQTGERYNVQPVRTASGMPELRNVPVRPGMAGLKASVLPGSLVLLCFADRDPSRPQIFAHDAPDSPGWNPLSFQIGGPVGLPIAYQGSTVQAGPFAGAVTLGSTLAKVRP